MKNWYGLLYELLNMGMQTSILKFQWKTDCWEKPSSKASPINAEVPKFISLGSKRQKHENGTTVFLPNPSKKLFLV